MYPWQAWFQPFWSSDGASYFAPLSGPTNTVTDWFSPDININVGDPHIERAVTQNVATYGKQLGVILNAIEELAELTKAKGGAITALKKMAQDIQAQKEQSRNGLESNTLSALETLKATDKEAFDRVMKQVK